MQNMMASFRTCCPTLDELGGKMNLSNIYKGLEFEVVFFTGRRKFLKSLEKKVILLWRREDLLLGITKREAYLSFAMKKGLAMAVEWTLFHQDL